MIWDGINPPSSAVMENLTTQPPAAIRAGRTLSSRQPDSPIAVPLSQAVSLSVVFSPISVELEIAAELFGPESVQFREFERDVRQRMERTRSPNRIHSNQEVQRRRVTFDARTAMPEEVLVIERMASEAAEDIGMASNFPPARGRRGRQRQLFTYPVYEQDLVSSRIRNSTRPSQRGRTENVLTDKEPTEAASEAVAPLVDFPATANEQAEGSVMTNWHDASINVKETSIDVLENQLTAGETVKLKSSEGATEILVTNTKEGHVSLLLREPLEGNTEMYETAVGLIAKQAVLNKDSNQFEVQVAVTVQQQSSKDDSFAVKIPGPDSELSYCATTITCSCGKPALKSPMTFECVGCKGSYHKACPTYFEENKCKPCASSFKGLAWGYGGKYVNTCPSDTLLTPILDHHTHTDMNLLRDLNKFRHLNAVEKDFVNGLNKMTQGNDKNFLEGYELAASRTAKVAKVKHKPTDCFTGMNEVTNNFHSIAGFNRLVHCPGVNGKDCKAPIGMNYYPAIQINREIVDDDVAGAMMSQMFEERVDVANGGICRPCSRKAINVDPPVRMEMPLSIPDKACPPVFLNFETNGALSIDDAFKAPDVFTVDGVTYQKKSIAICRRNQNHYICHFRRDDLWITYDGMKDNKYHATTPVEMCQLQPEHFVEQISYFKRTHLHQGATSHN